MMKRTDFEREAGFAAKFVMAGLCGFVIDALVLHLGLNAGLSPAIARAVSILTALQLTFFINGVVIFKCLEMGNCARRWAAYMLTSGFGNACSYVIFVTLSSVHGSPLSKSWIAFPASTFAAYLINVVGARFIVFGRTVRARMIAAADCRDAAAVEATAVRV